MSINLDSFTHWLMVLVYMKNQINKGIIDMLLLRLEGSKAQKELETALNRLEMYHNSGIVPGTGAEAAEGMRH